MHCHWHPYGYAAPVPYPPAYHEAPPEAPPPTRASGEDEIVTVLHDLREQVSDLRREVDELRRSGSMRH